LGWEDETTGEVKRM
jgi:hypothetical protein